jgi:hypothetical protein
MKGKGINNLRFWIYELRLYMTIFTNYSWDDELKS